jgi:hypothetical protein
MGRGFRAYLVLSVLLPIVLLYPTLIYTDLAGMGGYDGFASHSMMTEHGLWAPANGLPSPVYVLFASIALLWFLSVVNLGVAGVLAVKRITAGRRTTTR